MNNLYAFYINSLVLLLILITILLEWKLEKIKLIQSEDKLGIVKKKEIANICKISWENRKDGLHNHTKEKTCYTALEMSFKLFRKNYRMS